MGEIIKTNLFSKLYEKKKTGYFRVGIPEITFVEENYNVGLAEICLLISVSLVVLRYYYYYSI